MSSELNGPDGSAQTEPTSGAELTFRVKPSFQFLYTLPVLLALAILVDALSAPEPQKWLFLLLVLALAAIATPRGWSTVTLDGERLTLHTPLHRPRVVDLRHLLTLETSSRVGAALVLRYHPDDSHGQPDLTHEVVMGLPPLQDQALLEEHLRNDHATSH